MMRSIQTKFILLILGCVLLSASLIGGIVIINSRRVVDEDSTRIMNLTCSEKAADINSLLARIEQSTETLAFYTKNELDSVERLKNDKAYLEEFTRRMEIVSTNVANSTDGAIAVYIRFNPQLTTPTAGFFWRKEKVNSEFKKLSTTDLSLYDPSDTEHVGWYYAPIQKRQASWVAPYNNRNINVRVISYVAPLFVDGQIIGVVGMDVNFDLISQTVANMKVYETGYAFLVDNSGNIVYHSSIPYGTGLFDFTQFAPLKNSFSYGSSDNNLINYNFDGQDKKLAFRSMKNGMRLAITAPATEIDRSKNDLIRQILIVSTVIAIIAAILTVLMSRRITKPLLELTEAAQKIAAGDLSVSIKSHTNDEVGRLADSFQKTVQHLQKYIYYINSLAYKDSLTGVKSKAAYKEAITQIELSILSNKAEFAVVVTDINHLKYVNDHYGHDFGDMFIKDACKLICKAFKHSPVYRIGGDEFVIILEAQDFKIHEILLQELNDSIKIHNKNNSNSPYQISIAIGVATYQPDVDATFGAVFKRADEAMYQNKADMKTSQTTCE